MPDNETIEISLQHIHDLLDRLEQSESSALIRYKNYCMLEEALKLSDDSAVPSLSGYKLHAYRQMQQQESEALLKSLKHCDIQSTGSLYSVHGKNEFLSLLMLTLENMPDEDIQLVMVWVDYWLKELQEQLQTDKPNHTQLEEAGITTPQFAVMRLLKLMLG